MPEPTKPKSTKAKSTKTKAVNPPQAASKLEVAQETPNGEPPSPTPSAFRASTRINGIFTGIREHWQFALTFFVACAGTWLLLNQNELLKSQNILIQHQMSLEEASRRSALVMLMSNIMDKVDKEIEAQQEELSKQARVTARYDLSQSLIGQIAALSHSFKPYRYLQNDTLIFKPLSPERGQLLITLTQLPLDSSSFSKIYEASTFEDADLQKAVLSSAYLRNAYLRGANLSEAFLYAADLQGADLANANLQAADLIWANLREVRFNGANMRGAGLNRADLRKAVLVKTDLRQALLIRADLRGAKLMGADLRAAYLDGRDSSGIDSTVYIWKGDDIIQHMVSTNFNGANLLTGADLTGADLTGANLTGADLTGTILTGTIMSIGQIAELRSLYDCRGLHDSIKTMFLKTHPQLFEMPIE